MVPCARGAEANPAGSAVPAAPEIQGTELPTGLRQWTSSDGKTMKAKLLAVNHGQKTVKLELESGKILDGVAFSRFSAADQAIFASSQTSAPPRKGEITRVKTEDAAMNEAMEKARETFPAAWLEIQKDGSRIIPALSMILVKAHFSDQTQLGSKADDIEHMWVEDFTFDGKEITGTLASRPGKLKSVKEGDKVRFPLSRLSDWSYAADGKVQGAFTVKLLHSRMSAEEKKRHSEATGVDWDAQ